MVSSLMGLMYLSGHIDCADGFNKKLMKEACDIYKKYRSNIVSSVPVYPDGTFNMSDNGIYSYGLLDNENKTLLLAVWSTGGEERKKTINLSKYMKNPSIEIVYPGLPEFAKYELKEGTLNVEFAEEKTAVFFVFKE